MNETRSDAMSRIAEQLERNGYQVFLEPGAAAIPFDFGGYQPDILAVRGDEHLLVEVKSASAKQTLERYKNIVDTISRRPNWRFLVATVSAEPGASEALAVPAVSADELASLMARLDTLIVSESYEFAIPYMWNALMAGLRLRAFEKRVPVDATSDLRVIDYMYSLGEISHADYESMRSYMALRNSTVHSLGSMVPKEQVMEFNAYIRDKLAEWNLLPGSSNFVQ